MFQWIIGHSSFSHNTSQQEEKIFTKTINSYSGWEQRGPTSKRTIIGCAEPIHWATKGSVVRELDYSQDMEVYFRLAHWMFLIKPCAEIYSSFHWSREQNSLEFFSRNIDFFAFTYGSCINVRQNLYMGLLWKACSPIQLHLLNKNLLSAKGALGPMRSSYFLGATDWETKVDPSLVSTWKDLQAVCACPGVLRQEGTSSIWDGAEQSFVSSNQIHGVTWQMDPKKAFSEGSNNKKLFNQNKLFLILTQHNIIFYSVAPKFLAFNIEISVFCLKGIYYKVATKSDRNISNRKNKASSSGIT